MWGRRQDRRAMESKLTAISIFLLRYCLLYPSQFNWTYLKKTLPPQFSSDWRMKFYPGKANVTVCTSSSSCYRTGAETFFIPLTFCSHVLKSKIPIEFCKLKAVDTVVRRMWLLCNNPNTGFEDDLCSHSSPQLSKHWAQLCVNDTESFLSLVYLPPYKQMDTSSEVGSMVSGRYYIYHNYHGRGKSISLNWAGWLIKGYVPWLESSTDLIMLWGKLAVASYTVFFS